MQIGITERGDPALDFSWVNKLKDGNIIISKDIRGKFFQQYLIENKDIIILHIGCTGLGGTIVEPNVPSVSETCLSAKRLIEHGFPIDHMVLRIDPILPIPKVLNQIRIILTMFSDLGIKRVRYSFLDMYNHVKTRFIKAGFPLPYNSFHAPIEMRKNVWNIMDEFPMFDYEVCAEPETPHSKIGCLSVKDLNILGLKSNCKPTGKQRKLCNCLNLKTELLTTNKRCKHQCLYCYWRD